MKIGNETNIFQGHVDVFGSKLMVSNVDSLPLFEYLENGYGRKKMQEKSYSLPISTIWAIF